MIRAAILSCALSAGCFYADAINQRPSIEIRQTSDELTYRNSDVTLQAVKHDPDGHVVFVTWRVYLCTDATRPAEGVHPPGCDTELFETGVDNAVSFRVPSLRLNEAVPVQVVLVILQAEDDYGAIARPHQELLIPIANHAPDLDTRVGVSRYGYVVDTPIDLFAKVEDLDDRADNVMPVVWEVFTPMNQPAYDLVELDVPDPDAPTSLQFGKRFTPKGVGEWEIQITATDPLGAATKNSLIVNVVPDGAPCLAQWAPIAAPAGSAWPLTEPTLFQVSVVADDLDPYPTVPGDPELGTTAFTWSIKPPGGARDVLGVTGNQASLDPANYAPGDIVELRVEIEDRNQTPITCADANATCSVISEPQCIQRLTWRVEVR